MRKEGARCGQDQDHVLAFLGVLQPADRGAGRGFLKAAGLDAEFSVAGPALAAAACATVTRFDPSAVSRASHPRTAALDLVHFARSISGTDSSSPLARPIRHSRGQSSLARGCSSITARSRSPCSSMPCTGAASITARSAWSTPAAPRQCRRRFGRARATTCISKARRRSGWRGTRSACGRLGRRGDRPGGVQQLCARRDFIATDGARVHRAYAQARAWVRETPAAQVAEIEAGYFKDVDREVLMRTIAAYQRLGCWAVRWRSPAMPAR